ncbi:MAG: TolB family protein [Solirubrobacterales bacterium]
MRTIQAVVGTLVVAAITAALGPAVGFAAYPGKNGRLAVEGDTRPGIWTVRPNGDDRMLVTGKNGLPFNPQWSPNGRWIAFTQFGSLWKIRADGSQKSRLAKGVASDIGTNVSWSPDSRMLVFNKKDDLWRVRADGTNAKQLTNTADAETAPAWSPNGGRIAFQFRDAITADDELRLIKANGTGEVSIPNTVNGAEPDWSPNGTRLAYQWLGNGIALINPNGTGKTIFAKNGKFFVADPAWSPGGEHIAYAHNRGTDNTQIVFKAVNGGPERLVIARHHWFSPSWQPK